MTVESVKNQMQREVTRVRGLVDPAARAHEVIALDRQLRNAQRRLAEIKRAAWRELMDEYCWSTIDIGREYKISRQRVSRSLRVLFSEPEK